MKDEQLFKIKDFLSHELRRQRSEKGWNQAEAAKFLDMGERTYQRYEDAEDISCAFSKAILMLDSFSQMSNYELKDWFIKTCCPDDQKDFRTKFRWEEKMLDTLHEISPALRREFSKCIENEAIEKTETIILMSLLLFKMSQKEIESLLIYAFTKADEETLPKRIVKEYMGKYIDALTKKTK